MAPQDDRSLEAARVAAKAFRHQPYLLTVTTGLQPHCRPVQVRWDVERTRLLVTPKPRGWDDGVASAHRLVSLLWPPDDPGGYSLIVDGETGDSDEAGGLIVVPSRAVLHRPGRPAGTGATSCGSDCLPLYPC